MVVSDSRQGQGVLMCFRGNALRNSLSADFITAANRSPGGPMVCGVRWPGAGLQEEMEIPGSKSMSPSMARSKVTNLALRFRSQLTAGQSPLVRQGTTIATG